MDLSKAAFRASQLATKLAQEDLKSINDNLQCRQCKGEGKIHITCDTFGSNKPPSVSDIPCPNCKSKGIVSEEDMKVQIINEHLWCKCSIDDDYTSSVKAKDGIAVFNNDTYVCTNCSMITQFG